jgi:hypothetical protein
MSLGRQGDRRLVVIDQTHQDAALEIEPGPLTPLKPTFSNRLVG